MKMKRTGTILLTIVMAMTLFAGCAKKTPKPSGVYGSGYTYKYTFNGNEVICEFSETTDGKNYVEKGRGTFEMDENNKVKITYSNGKTETITYNPEKDTLSILMGLATLPKG